MEYQAINGFFEACLDEVEPRHETLEETLDFGEVGRIECGCAHVRLGEANRKGNFVPISHERVTEFAGMFQPLGNGMFNFFGSV